VTTPGTRATDSDRKPGGSLDMSIYVSDSANNSGHIDIAPDGTVKAIYPPDY
jgi:hypothetical protein